MKTAPDIQIWLLNRIKPYEQNAKVHEAAQVSAIAQSIRQFGWTQPIVVDTNGVIIAGHGRRLAALELGLKEVPVWVRSDLTPEQVRALRLVDNRVAESKIDTEMFRLELADLDYNLTDFFDAKELDFAVADLGQVNPDAFVVDVGAAVAQQESQSRELEAHARVANVTLAKAFGFKDVPGPAQKVINAFMAWAEEHTGKKDADALVDAMQLAMKG